MVNKKMFVRSSRLKNGFAVYYIPSKYIHPVFAVAISKVRDIGGLPLHKGYTKGDNIKFHSVSIGEVVDRVNRHVFGQKVYRAVFDVNGAERTTKFFTKEYLEEFMMDCDGTFLRIEPNEEEL